MAKNITDIDLINKILESAGEQDSTKIFCKLCQYFNQNKIDISEETKGSLHLFCKLTS